MIRRKGGVCSFKTVNNEIQKRTMFFFVYVFVHVLRVKEESVRREKIMVKKERREKVNYVFCFTCKTADSIPLLPLRALLPRPHYI